MLINLLNYENGLGMLSEDFVNVADTKNIQRPRMKLTQRSIDSL